MQILLYAIALPSFVGVMFSYCGNLARKISVLTGFNGCALAVTLLLSSMSQESLIQFASQNRWLWFPLTTFMIAVLTDACGLFKKIMPLRIYIACAVIILGAALLLIPSWDNLSHRLFLGVAVGGCATVLMLVVEKRKCFSTSLALSFSLITPSVLAMLSGFAKLAIPLGAVAFCPFGFPGRNLEHLRCRFFCCFCQSENSFLRWRPVRVLVNKSFLFSPNILTISYVLLYEIY